MDPSISRYNLEPMFVAVCFSIVCLNLHADVKNAATNTKRLEQLTADENHKHGLGNHTDSDFKLPRPFQPSPDLSVMDHNDAAYVQAWNRFTLIDDYKTVGKTNISWDSYVIAAFETLSKLRALSNHSPDAAKLVGEVTAQTTKAINAGCVDPMLKCLEVEFVTSNQSNATRAIVAEAWRHAAWELDISEYSSFRKAYAFVHASDALKVKAGNATNQPPELWALRAEGIFHIDEALHDPMMPPREGCDVWWDLWHNLNRNQEGREEMKKRSVATLEKLWPDHAFTYLARGSAYLEDAWDARGGEWSDQVTKSGWAGYIANLDKAEVFLRKSWALDQTNEKTPTAMIKLAMGKSYTHREMNAWFERAMGINPECYEAARAKAYYLEPRWFGSVEETVAFGRECVAKWGGRVPLVLAVTHESLAQVERRFGRDSANPSQPKKSGSYWREPGVWKDVHDSYQRFLELNPNSRWERCHYARDAYRCGEYGAFLDIVNGVDQAVKDEYFGGHEKFEKMVLTASQKLKKE